MRFDPNAISNLKEQRSRSLGPVRALMMKSARERTARRDDLVDGGNVIYGTIDSHWGKQKTQKGVTAFSFFTIYLDF